MYRYYASIRILDNVATIMTSPLTEFNKEFNLDLSNLVYYIGLKVNYHL